jgi:hypothetical protein
MTAIIPTPTYVLARAAWVPTLVIWHADGRFTRIASDPCADYAAALAAARGMSPPAYVIRFGGERERPTKSTRPAPLRSVPRDRSPPGRQDDTREV